MGLASEAVDILNVDHINLVVDVEALDVLPVPLDHVDELIAAVESREREKEERESVREEGRKEGSSSSEEERRNREKEEKKKTGLVSAREGTGGGVRKRELAARATRTHTSTTHAPCIFAKEDIAVENSVLL